MKNKDVKTKYMIAVIDSFCRYIKYQLYDNYEQKESLKSFCEDILVLINIFNLNEDLMKEYSYIKKALDKTNKKLYELLKCFELPEDETYKIAYEK